MSPTLSVVLPVKNAEAQLSRQVSNLLEVLPDLTSQFEVLIVDDGSTDSTEEVAQELTTEYPQLKFKRLSERHGRDAAIQAGVENSGGDYVYIAEESGHVSPTKIRHLWDNRQEEAVPTVT